VPMPFFVFVFYDFRVARHALLCGGNTSSLDSLRVRREWFREHTIDRVRPTVVVSDNSICDMRHQITRFQKKACRIER